MELFYARSNSGSSVAECAALVLASVPPTMCAIRAEMRAGRPAELSLSQFRALIYLRYHAGASVSDVAAHLDLALSTTSQLIDGLLKGQHVTRETAADDRRRATLALTEHGAIMLEAIRARAQAQIAERLVELTPDERQAVSLAMEVLQRVFDTPDEHAARSSGSLPSGDET